MKTYDFTRLLGGLTISATIALSAAAGSAVESGKTIFNNTCVHCHGSGGAGNLGQDQFWKMRIPRLTEDYVQKKSDQELSDVILNGRRKMPPVVQGKAHTQDAKKITPEQVPDLIAYIRTLKK